MNTLSSEEVYRIHESLVKDFLESNDPISPPGIKSADLLESAISRQWTGYLDDLKYKTPYANAASLAYGICCNHPFYNGNKRTALVSMLCHLDKNDITFSEGVKHDDLYKFMIRVASHRLITRKKRDADYVDLEVQEMSKWIRRNSRKIEKGERVITYRELESILNNRDFWIEDLSGNFAFIVRYEEGKREGVRVMKIPYPGKGRSVDIKTIKSIREKCGLTEGQGVDSKTFYKSQKPVDDFIKKYRTLLKRLART